MRIRTARWADAPEIARVRVDSWRTTYRGMLPDEYLDGLSVEYHTRNWQGLLRDEQGQEFTYVAETEGGEVVGFVTGGVERTNHPEYAGELYAIYLLEGYQGQGLGRRLAGTLGRQMLAKGMPSMLVWVLSTNPARGFYEALGGQFLGEKAVLVGSGIYQEVSYGWKDVAELVRKTERGKG